MKSYIAISVAEPSPATKPVENRNALGGKSNTTLVLKWLRPAKITQNTVISMPTHSTTVSLPDAGDAAVEQHDHQHAHRHADRARRGGSHALPEIADVLREADISRGDFERSAEDELPDEQERQDAGRDWFSGTPRAGRRRCRRWPGMDAASSLQTRPSHSAMTAPSTQPSMHCGPPIDAMMSGMVMNGPTPTMLLMLSAVASSRPRPRIRPCLDVSI